MEVDPENVERVSLEVNPEKSIAFCSFTRKKFENTIRRILSEDLNFHPYKKILWRTQNSDYSSRLTFSEVMHEKIQSGEILLDFITITGETLTST